MGVETIRWTDIDLAPVPRWLPTGPYTVVKRYEFATAVEVVRRFVHPDEHYTSIACIHLVSTGAHLHLEATDSLAMIRATIGVVGAPRSGRFELLVRPRDLSGLENGGGADLTVAREQHGDLPAVHMEAEGRHRIAVCEEGKYPDFDALARKMAPGVEPQRREKYVDPDILLRLRGLRDWGEVAFCHSADREPLLFFAEQFGVRVQGAIMPRFSEPVPPTPRWERLP